MPLCYFWNRGITLENVNNGFLILASYLSFNTEFFSFVFQYYKYVVNSVC